jgi:glycosyltransferase involved in cell wall biosynthesis
VRVLFVNSMRSLGGGEQWLLEAAAGLASRGHTVSVAARPGSALASHSRRDGHRVLELPMRGDADVDSILRLARWIDTNRVDILSVNVQRAVRLGCAAAHLSGRPPVVERRGLSFPVRPTVLNRLIYRRCVSHVVANCRAVADGLTETGVVDPSMVSVIVNGIDPARVPAGGGEAVRRELGVPVAAPLISVIGRLVVDKRHSVALKAFRGVLADIPDARLLVVGSGKLDGELRAVAQRSFESGRVIFTGRRDDVARVLDASDVLLVTSDREGMPHVILEAMVAGTPVVSTRVAGVPEMIDDGVHGLLVPTGSADDAARAVVRLLTEVGLSRRLTEAARMRALDEFSLTTMIDRVERLFQSLSGDTHTAAQGVS